MAVLTGYFALTLAYSFTLKRRLMVDIVVLASLYTTRVIAGAAAILVVPSEWLLAFSMFIFTCLALVKRYVELALRIDKEIPDPSNRNYRLIDLPIIGALAAASGFNAVTIFALYVSSPAVNGLYRHPELLWLICPILLYWIGRMVVLAHRRVVDDDPIVFALRDRNSYICAASMIIIILLGSGGRFLGIEEDDVLGERLTFITPPMIRHTLINLVAEIGSPNIKRHTALCAQ